MMPSVLEDYLPTQTLPAQPGVILCVEDDPNLLSSLEIQLQQRWAGLGYEIEVAENGEQALEMLKALAAAGKNLCLIISDQVMTPALPGDQLLIEAHRIFPEAKEVMLTGQAQMAHVANAVNHADLYRYLTKPWNEEDLRLTIEGALDAYGLQLALAQYQADLARLNRTTGKLIMTRDRELLLHAVMEAALRFSRAHRGLLLLLQQGELVPLAEGRQDVAAAAVAIDIPPAQPVSLPELLLGQVQQQPGPQRGQHGGAAYYAVPLMNQGVLLGIIYLEAEREAVLVQPHQQALIDILAGAVAIALENYQLIQGLEEKVKARTEQMEEMVRIASHDIRSPLTGVRELTALMQDPDMAEPEQVARFAGIIRNAITSVLRLVDDILDLSKLEHSGQLEASVKPLRPFLEQLVQGYEGLVVSKKLRLQLEAPEGLAARLDASKLGQALGNLLANAIKFTPSEGTVSVVADSVEEHGTPYVRIRVADTGMGIPQADLPRLFERFGATQRKGTQGEKGTGLGLSITHRIVQLHGGTLSVASEEGVGTTFTILLPTT